MARSLNCLTKDIKRIKVIPPDFNVLGSLVVIEAWSLLFLDALASIKRMRVAADERQAVTRFSKRCNQIEARALLGISHCAHERCAKLVGEIPGCLEVSTFGRSWFWLANASDATPTTEKASFHSRPFGLANSHYLGALVWIRQVKTVPTSQLFCRDSLPLETEMPG
jgi:hypothetical protein